MNDTSTSARLSPRDGRLAGKIVFVSGAGSVGPGWGNGRAISVLFAEEGASIFGVDRTLEHMTETARCIERNGGTFVASTCDATESDSIAAAVARCIESFGRIDVLVNNVGGSAKGGPIEMDESVFDAQVDQNLKSVFLTCKHVLPHMLAQGSGSIVNLSSTSGIRWTGSAQVAYAATKAGVIQFSKVLAVQYAGKSIRVNSVVPGQLHTPMVEVRLAAMSVNCCASGSRAFPCPSWAMAATPRTPRCFWPVTSPASSPALKSSSMAACRRAATDHPQRSRLQPGPTRRRKAMSISSSLSPSRWARSCRGHSSMPLRPG
jgi:NAD(P)-dependent dehydrogenase (short-subunit alcohol dehydrogenase family)